MIKFRKINIKKLAAITIVGVVLITTGCSSKTASVEMNEQKTNAVYEEVIYDNMQEVNVDNKENDEVLQKEEDVVFTSNEQKEEYIVDYFENAENKIDQILQSDSVKTIKTESKEVFVTLVDFLFYNGEIKGITYNELSDETKIKLLEITNNVDTKIEAKVPGYKDTIKDSAGKTYKYVSEKITDGKDYLEQKIISEIGEEKYNNIINDVKTGTDNAINYSKDIYETSKQKLKKWYEGWK
ncbi:MAG: hypothetical protein II309_03310 [Bacilli bacterium]|nr:hypothetical protein [Bacilli bacterium]